MATGDIEVIGAGLGRTGTKSLQAALDVLGYKTYHFPLPAHAETWAKFSEGQVTSDVVLEAPRKATSQQSQLKQPAETVS